MFMRVCGISVHFPTFFQQPNVIKSLIYIINMAKKVDKWTEPLKMVKNEFPFGKICAILKKPHNRILTLLKGNHFGKKCFLSLLVP